MKNQPYGQDICYIYGYKSQTSIIMNRLLSIRFALLAGLASLVSLSLQAQTFNVGFEERYEKNVKFLEEARKTVYDGPVRPVWKDGSSFLHITTEPDSARVYEVDAVSATKKEATRAEFDELMKKSSRGYYDPSDESMYSLGNEKPKVSPDGTLEAFFRDNNIWIKEVGKDDSARQLSYDGTDADHYVRIQWSPDSKKIAAFRKEVLKERQILLRDSRPKDKVQPEYKWLDYAKPGDALPQVTPAIFDVEKMESVPVGSEWPDQYFMEMGKWSPDSKFFTFEYNKRGHQLYQLVAMDAETGKCRILAEEKSKTFVYYYDLYRHYFEDGRRILWISERDDWRHLYMIDAVTGDIRQITKGEWNVREIHQVDEKNGIVLMNVNGLHSQEGEDPYNKHLVRLDLATGRITDLTPENANHSVYFSKDFSCFVDNRSRPDSPCVSVVRSSKDGSVVMDIQKQDISGLLSRGYTMPIVFSAKGRDGVTDIWGTIYLPYKFDKRRKYPVIEYIYAGPHDSHVVKDFNPELRFAKLLELGFAVVTIDGMGTDNRSKSFQDVCWRNIKDAGFPDRILWMKAAAAKYKYLDISNVGIYGYSAGGQNTLSALLFHPEFYKVGVALCGCHDNRMDKMWWNEQWMGYPVGPWYGENSNVDNAWRLEGKLLLINGEMDNNVDPASTLQVVAELVKNGKYFEQMFLPGYSHNLGSDYITKRVFEFFWKNIMEK